jgi:hypothetical protein
MIEMPNSHTLPNDQASTEMDFDMLTTTISNFVSNTQLFFNKSNDNTSYDDPNMKFNDGHKLSLVAYRFVVYLFFDFVSQPLDIELSHVTFTCFYYIVF